jgi:hypothetical protein
MLTRSAHSVQEAALRQRTIVLVATLAVLLPTLGRSEVLTGDEQIRRALVGNTISGEEDGGQYTEYLHPDGRIVGMDRQGRYSGHWMIANGQICFRYLDGDKETDWDCSSVDLDGTQVKWRVDNSTAKLTPGNPSNF